MRSRGSALASIGVLAWIVLAASSASAGIRVDKAAPPRPPSPQRIPLSVDDRRSSSLQFAAGPAVAFVVDQAGGGEVVALTYERVGSPRSSRFLRVSSTNARDLTHYLSHTQDLRDGRIEFIERARIDAIEIGVRKSSHGASAFYIGAAGGVARTQLDGVTFWSSSDDRFRHERRVSTQLVVEATVGHLWQPVRFPLGPFLELGWSTRFGPPSGVQLSVRVGLLGQRAPTSD